MQQRNYRYDSGKYQTHWLLLQEVPVGSRVLEIGTASGYMGEYLIKEKNCEVWGVEPVQELYEDAKNYGYTKLFKNTAEEFLNLPEMSGQEFDVIFLGDVLEHMTDPLQVLIGLKKFLKPTGRFVISLPNVAHYSTRWELLAGRWDYKNGGIMDRTHMRFFTLKSMKELIEQAGLHLEKARPSNGGWERFGINKLFGIGRKLFFLWPKLIAIQYILVATKSKKNDQ